MELLHRVVGVAFLSALAGCDPEAETCPEEDEDEAMEAAEPSLPDLLVGEWERDLPESKICDDANGSTRYIFAPMDSPVRGGDVVKIVESSFPWDGECSCTHTFRGKYTLDDNAFLAVAFHEQDIRYCDGTDDLDGWSYDVLPELTNVSASSSGQVLLQDDQLVVDVRAYVRTQ